MSSDRSFEEFWKELRDLPDSERRQRLGEILREDFSEDDDTQDVSPPAWFREWLLQDEGSIDPSESSMPSHLRAPIEKVNAVLEDMVNPPTDDEGPPVGSIAHLADWDLEHVRYRGDVEDVRNLDRDYRVDQYLRACDEVQTVRRNSSRGRMLTHGVRLSERLSPRIFSIFRGVCDRLRVPVIPEIFCVNRPGIDASAGVHCSTTEIVATVEITADALEKLSDGELAFVLGHEIGHLLFGTASLLRLLPTGPEATTGSVLPRLGEALLLRWRKKAEISADRVGLLACGNFEAAANALVKSLYGLSSRNVQLEIDDLLEQIEELAGNRELMATSFDSHPLTPVRLKALELFSRSTKAATAGFVAGTEDLVKDDALEDAIDQLMGLTLRQPDTRLREAMMLAVGFGGGRMLAVDGSINDHEVKVLAEVLLKDFTDTPEQILNRITSSLQDATLEQALLSDFDKALSTVRENGSSMDREFVVARLAQIALADGALLGAETDQLIEVAERIGLSRAMAWRVIISVTQEMGLREDFQLGRFAADLRRAFPPESEQ